MASVREQIIAYVVAKLGESGKPAGLTVHRFRTRPIDRDSLPAQVVYPAGRDGGIAEAVSEYSGEGDVSRELTLRVESRVAGDAPDTLIDPLYVWAVKQIMSDTTLGGLALGVREEASSFDADEREVPVGACATDFVVTYSTEFDDPELQA